MIHEHDRVILTSPIADEGLEPGDIGAVVHVYPRNEAYEVEFGATAPNLPRVLTLQPDQIRRVSGDEISTRSKRGSREHFRKVLDAVSDRPPMPGDEL